MNAVNLIPADRRRGGADSPSGAYAVLGLLAVALLAVTVHVLAANRVSERRSELAATQRKAAAAQRQLAALKPYRDFARLAERRRATVSALAASRFDWQRTMADLGHLVTGGVWLQAVTGTVAPGVTVDGAGTSGGATFRSSLPNPALEIAGCATSNKQLVGFLARLRAMKGVVRVTLADAAKSDTAGTGGTSAEASSTGGCTSSDRWPAFNAVAFFAPLRGGLPATAAAGDATPASTTSPSGSGSTPPAATGSSSPSTTSASGSSAGG